MWDSRAAAPSAQPQHCHGCSCRYLGWDAYFMALAFLSARRSKDPSKQVGACIVDNKHIILGIGYNGFPRGIQDRELPWAKRSAKGTLHTKYPYVVRAWCLTLSARQAAAGPHLNPASGLWPCTYSGEQAGRWNQSAPVCAAARPCCTGTATAACNPVTHAHFCDDAPQLCVERARAAPRNL